MKNLRFIFSGMLWGLIHGQVTIPFDWGGQNGMLIYEGSLFWNRSWTSGVLLFDGTYTSFPKRFGDYSSQQFKPISTGNLPEYQPLPDSIRTTSQFDYYRGDYIYDQLDLRAKYEAKNQWIHINGFKRTHGGNTGYYLHPAGGKSPIHHNFRLDYGVKRGERRIEVSAGRYVTRSGLPDSTQNGSEDDNIITAGFRIDQPIGQWVVNSHFAQFTQHRKVHHAALSDSNYRDINRNLLNLQLKSPSGMVYGIEQQAQQISSSIHNRSLVWTKLYGRKQMGLFSVMGGVQILNSDDAFPFVWGLDYHKPIGNGYIKFSSLGAPTPKHPDLDDPTDGTAFEYWSRSSIRGGYQTSTVDIKGYLALTQNSFIGTDSTFVTLAGGEISYRFQTGWSLFSSFYTQLDSSQYLGGIGTQIEAGMKGKLNLFKNAMKIDATIWATGSQGRMRSFAYHPILQTPFKHQNSDWSLPDRWLLHFEAVANISGVLVTYRINNLLNAFGETGDQAWVRQNYLYPPLGRMMQFGVSWSFDN